jgi:hypothetical protein
VREHGTDDRATFSRGSPRECRRKIFESDAAMRAIQGIENEPERSTEHQ